MKKKVMVGLVSVVVAVALVFGGVTFYNNRQQEKFEKQMASYESVDTMQHPSEATTSIDGILVLFFVVFFVVTFGFLPKIGRAHV